MNYVESLSLFHVDAKEIPCVTEKGAPTEKTQGAPGVLYMDTGTGDLYKCRAADAVHEVYTWEKIGGGNSEYKLPIGGEQLGGVKNGGNVKINADGTMMAPVSDSSQNGDCVKTVNGIKPDETGNVEISVSGGSGLTASAKNLLISILRNGIYRDDFDAASTITALETELAATAGGAGGGGGGTSYTIDNVLTNVTNKNTVESIASGSTYIGILTPAGDMEISSVVVTMNGVDITKTAYADGVVTILAVTGNVVITAIAEEKLVDITQNADGTLLIVAAKSVAQNTDGTLLIA